MRHRNIFNIYISTFICSLFFFFASNLNAQANLTHKSFVYQDVNEKFKNQTTLGKINKENKSVVYAVISDDCPKCFDDLKVLSAIIKSKKNIKFYSVQDHLNAEKDAPNDRVERHNFLLRNSSGYGIDAKPIPLMLPIKFSITDISESLKLSEPMKTDKLPFYILCEDKKCNLFEDSISDDYSTMQNFFQKIEHMSDLPPPSDTSSNSNTPSKGTDGSFDFLSVIGIVLLIVTAIFFLIKRK
jgi:hypothetical protein